MTLSIRATLTAWYVGALAVVMLAFAGASWWLSTQSVLGATDTSLRARIAGVRTFLENPRTRLTVDSLQDEFAEYAELTRGEALLEVVTGPGIVLCRPSIPGWPDLSTAASDRAAGNVQPHERMIGGLPFRVASARLFAHGRAYDVTVAAPMRAAYEALNDFHRLQLALVPLLLALAGAGGYWISRRALAPVDQMTRAVQAITVQSLDRRLDLPPANDELRRLASTFNGMLARLEVAVADIVRFTADASHELRTPVSIIRTTAELALRHPRSAEEYREALVDVGAHARHMSELVNDLLELARTDAGIEPQRMTRLNLAQAATDARVKIRELADQRHISLDVHVPDGPVWVIGDELALKRLAGILLENAVKYSGSDDSIQLTVRLQRLPGGDRAILTVCDNGIGVQPEDGTRVFERFYRGDRARQHAPDGTGLGLAIAQAIVARHRGTIELDPSGGGRESGARFTVSLPAASSVSDAE